jgi:hypothetical protein
MSMLQLTNRRKGDRDLMWEQIPNSRRKLKFDAGLEVSILAEHQYGAIEGVA